MVSTTTLALGVDCPTCPAKVGKNCFTVKFDKPKPRAPHKKRRLLAKEGGLEVFTPPPSVDEEVVSDDTAPFGKDDTVLYTCPETGQGSKTGKVVWVKDGGVKVKPTAEFLEPLVIPCRQVKGFWPKGAKTYSLRKMVVVA